MFTVLSRQSIQERFQVVIPPGSYLLTDPCYILDDALYQEKHELVFVGHHIDNVLLTSELGVLLNWATLIGDGRYHCTINLPKSSVPTRGLAVDSGQLAIVDVRYWQKERDRDLTNFAAFFTLVEPLSVTLTPRANLLSDHNSLEVIVDEDEFLND